MIVKGEVGTAVSDQLSFARESVHSAGLVARVD
jgi:hypothetical protein